jgi:hypothetical protein
MKRLCGDIINGNFSTGERAKWKKIKNSKN